MRAFFDAAWLICGRAFTAQRFRRFRWLRHWAFRRGHLTEGAGDWGRFLGHIASSVEYGVWVIKGLPVGLQSASSLVMHDLVSHVRTFCTAIESLADYPCLDDEEMSRAEMDPERASHQGHYG
jgi:hypothetical protein